MCGILSELRFGSPTKMRRILRVYLFKTIPSSCGLSESDHDSLGRNAVDLGYVHEAKWDFDEGLRG
jgi:hypothetical protein